MEFLASLAGPGGGRRARLARTFAALHERGEALFARMWEGLAAIPGVTLYGLPPGGRRTPTAGFAVAGVASEDVVKALVPHGVSRRTATSTRRRSSSASATGRTASSAAGAACYTTEDEIDRLVHGVRAVARG